MKFTYAGYSDVGVHHKKNDDRMMINGKIASKFLDTTADEFYAVLCDGVGGRAHGDVAAQIAVECMAELECRFDAQSLYEQVALANERILGAQRKDQERQNMSTTIAGISLVDNTGIVFNLGDTRVYQCSGGLKQLTIDHTYVQLFMKNSPTSKLADIPEELRHIIFNFLGKPAKRLPLEVGSHHIDSGTIVVLSTDGLHDVVSADDISHILKKEESVYEQCRELVTLAIEHGTMDNISVIICKVG